MSTMQWVALAVLFILLIIIVRRPRLYPCFFYFCLLCAVKIPFLSIKWFDHSWMLIESLVLAFWLLSIIEAFFWMTVDSKGKRHIGRMLIGVWAWAFVFLRPESFIAVRDAIYQASAVVLFAGFLYLVIWPTRVELYAFVHWLMLLGLSAAHIAARFGGGYSYFPTRAIYLWWFVIQMGAWAAIWVLLTPALRPKEAVAHPLYLFENE